MQNLPRPDNDNYNLRKAFIAPPGMLLIVADYAQLEVRIAASLSRDPVLCDSILKGLDLHSFTAANMFGEYSYERIVWGNENKKNKDLPEEELKLAKKLGEMRSAAKAILFGLFYGRGAQSLAVELDLMRKHQISFEEAKEMASDMIQRFFEVYPVLQNFIRSTQASCRRQGYVRTWLGRKRRLPSMNSSDRKMRAEAERQCFNSVIQGSASDIAMVAMLTCNEDPFLQAHGCRLLMQVHDELIFQVPAEFAEPSLVRVKHCMEYPFSQHFSVPMEVSAGIASNWSDAK